MFLVGGLKVFEKRKQGGWSSLYVSWRPWFSGKIHILGVRSLVGLMVFVRAEKEESYSRLYGGKLPSTSMTVHAVLQNWFKCQSVVCLDKSNNMIETL